MVLNTNGNLSLGTTENAAKMTVGLAGVAITGNTDGATMGASSIFHLYDANSVTANSTVMLLGGGGGAAGSIKSGIGFSRENAGNWGTQLRFYVHPTSTSDIDALNEVARFDASGNFIIGKTTALDFNEQGVTLNYATIGGTRANGATLQINRTGSDGNIAEFYRQGAIAGRITVSSGAASYLSGSDYRLKDNIVPLTGATARLMALKPSRFTFLTDPDTTVDGFIAHEVVSIVPEAIDGEKDAVDAEGNPIYQGIDHGKLVPLLVATIQELTARIEALEGA